MPNVDPKHIVHLKGKPFVTWAGLITAAHEAGLQSIEVNLIQFPASDNGGLAIAQAKVTLEDGRSFTEIGDASAHNVGPHIVPHICRMAATRAKGRALRDALGVEWAMAEELGDLKADEPYEEPSRDLNEDAPRAPRAPRARTNGNGQAKVSESEGEVPCDVPGCGVLIKAKLAAASRKAFDGKALCSHHIGALTSGRGG